MLCVVKDNADPVMDEMLAQFVVSSHLRNHPKFDEQYDEVRVATSVDADVRRLARLYSLTFLRGDAQIIEDSLLKKYIQYAKSRVKPKLAQLDQDKLARLYSDLRRESLSTGALPVSVRHLEAMIRMSEASAKMHLRE